MLSIPLVHCLKSQLVQLLEQNSISPLHIWQGWIFMTVSVRFAQNAGECLIYLSDCAVGLEKS